MLALLGVWFGLSLLLAPPLQQPSPRARGVGPRGAVRLEVSSPFESGSSSASASGALDLTLENVEQVLDEMRPYLIADGGNVAVTEIDGGVVRLELQGACGSCPSSTMTMKMGLERGLREKIPEIVAVEQVAPDGPQLTEEGVEEVLDEIRPFLKMAGGAVSLLALDAGGVQPTARLAITGSGSTINSVRVEIAQRLKRNFPTLVNVEYA
jgi:lysyl-tRNA synthetase class 2